MPTVSTHITGQPSVRLDGNMVGVVENYIDFATYNASNADVIRVLNLDEGTFVTDVFSRVVTVEGGAATGTVGDGDAAADWDASVNLNATAGTVTRSTVGTDNYAVGKYYATADTIDITLAADVDAAVMYFAAVCFWPEKMASQ